MSNNKYIKHESQEVRDAFWAGVNAAWDESCEGHNGEYSIHDDGKPGTIDLYIFNLIKDMADLLDD